MYDENDVLRCTDCDGAFKLINLSKHYDAIYCGSENLQLKEVGF
jgi:hypothetical protein